MPEAFLQAFMSANLEADEFTHKDHVRAAWLILQRLPLDQAMDEYARCIRTLAAKFGVPDKFHATITQALMIIIADRLNHGETWDNFWIGNPDLANDAMSLLERYYSRELLYSSDARSDFLKPDLRLLPQQSAACR